MRSPMIADVTCGRLMSGMLMALIPPVTTTVDGCGLPRIAGASLPGPMHVRGTEALRVPVRAFPLTIRGQAPSAVCAVRRSGVSWLWVVRRISLIVQSTPAMATSRCELAGP